MTMKRKFHWGKIGNFAEWVAIPYESSDMLVIILPKSGANVDNVISSMSAVDLGNIIRDIDNDASKANVNLTLPKFKFESTTNLVEPLQRVSFKKQKREIFNIFIAILDGDQHHFHSTSPISIPVRRCRASYKRSTTSFNRR